MILVSNYLLLLKDFKLPKDAVVRVNLAHVDSVRGLNEILEVGNDVFLDFPKDRRKPPTGVIPLSVAIETMGIHSNVKYFAVSNTEDPNQIKTIRECVPYRVSVVPKIETIKGVLHLQGIIDAVNPAYIMLDSEDLFLDVGDVNIFKDMCSRVEETCKSNDVGLLRLSGVIFCDTMHS